VKLIEYDNTVRRPITTQPLELKNISKFYAFSGMQNTQHRPE